MFLAEASNKKKYSRIFAQNLDLREIAQKLVPNF